MLNSSPARCDGSCVPIHLDELETVTEPLDRLAWWLRLAPAAVTEFADYCATNSGDDARPDELELLDQLTHASLTLHRLIRQSTKQL